MRVETKRIFLLTGIFLVTAVAAYSAARHRVSPTRAPDWSSVSSNFAGWRGADTMFDPIYGDDPADTSLLKVFDRKPGESVIVYVAFYRDLAKILELHTPERCYAGQGWQTIKIENTSFGSLRGKTIPMKEMLVEKAGRRRLVLWWYMAGPRPFENRIRYIYAMLAMSTLTGRTDGALVRFETPFDAGQEVTARARIEEFARNFQEQLDKALPN